MKVSLEVRDQFFNRLYKKIFCLIENKGVVNELRMLKNKNPKSYVSISGLGCVQKVSSRRKDLESQVLSFRDEDLIEFNICFPVLDKNSVLHIQIEMEETNYRIRTERGSIHIVKGILNKKFEVKEETSITLVILIIIQELAKECLKIK
jgi:hypothetical protein